MSHSKEPWGLICVPTQIGSCYKVGPKDEIEKGHGSFACLYDDYRSQNEKTDQSANAARIVACVNACSGIENPQNFRELFIDCTAEDTEIRKLLVEFDKSDSFCYEPTADLVEKATSEITKLRAEIAELKKENERLIQLQVETHGALLWAREQLADAKESAASRNDF